MPDTAAFKQLAAEVRQLDAGDTWVRYVGIPVVNPNATIGPSPTVRVACVSRGNDWDDGTLFIQPDRPLTTLSPADLEEIHQLRREGQSWAMHKAYERWAREYDGLVDINQKLRCALLQRGMSTDELITLAGEPTRKKGRQIKDAQ